MQLNRQHVCLACMKRGMGAVHSWNFSTPEWIQQYHKSSSATCGANLGYIRPVLENKNRAGDTKPKDPSSIPETHSVERTDSQGCCDVYVHCAHTQVNIS